MLGKIVTHPVNTNFKVRVTCTYVKKPDARWVLSAALSSAQLWPGKEMQPAPQHLQSSTGSAWRPHLLNVYQLGLVDLRNGDVVLGSDSESPLEKAEVAGEMGAPPPLSAHSIYRAASLTSTSVHKLPAQLLTMSV